VSYLKKVDGFANDAKNGTFFLARLKFMFDFNYSSLPPKYAT
jgi:hypothetical protein